MSADQAKAIVGAASRGQGSLGVRSSTLDDDTNLDPWMLPSSGRVKGELVDEPIQGILPEKVRIVYSNMVYIEKTGLPSALVSRLVRLAAFQNPEFYKAQTMRLPTYNKPRV